MKSKQKARAEFTAMAKTRFQQRGHFVIQFNMLWKNISALFVIISHQQVNKLFQFFVLTQWDASQTSLIVCQFFFKTWTLENFELSCLTAHSRSLCPPCSQNLNLHQIPFGVWEDATLVKHAEGGTQNNHSLAVKTLLLLHYSSLLHYY